MQNLNKLLINVTPVILCGGQGSRLWPLSRAAYPKQFVAFSGSKTLFQQAVDRLCQLESDSISIDQMLIVTGEDHRFLVLDQLRELVNVSTKFLLEPSSKNTAPALTLAALEAVKDGKDPILIVTPADQIIQDLNSFKDILQKAVKLAAEGTIIVFGIKPIAPATGFGYIKQKNSPGKYGEFDVERFVEKPDINKARNYFSSGEYFWNSGIFMMRASKWLEAIKKFRPNIWSLTYQAHLNSSQDQAFVRPDSELFSIIESESIDYAVIEKCPQSEFSIKMIPMDVGWNDLGAWSEVWETGDKDLNLNVLHGDVLTSCTKSSLVYSSHRLVSVLGMNNVAIIETADAILVADRNHSQDVKNIVVQLKQQSREEHLLHRKVLRPWGWYDNLDVGKGFKVKRIYINPGASLSLQRHQKRAEHWVVIRGTAQVTCGEKTFQIYENESTYIPRGEKHRLENLTNAPLEIIEVQCGKYLTEDDIERFDDFYGRVKNA